MIVAIDGPAGSGKGTVSKRVAELCNLTYIDTGMTYRSLSLAALRNNIKVNETDKLIELAKTSKIELTLDNKVLLNNEDVTNYLRTKEVNEIVSQVSAIPEIREIAVQIQREIVKDKDAILEGRDITTVVFPNAEYKFYLDASIEERVKRRIKQNDENNIDMSYDEVYNNIKFRDLNDETKEVGALKRTDEQIYIDSTNMTIDEVINKIIKIVKR